MRYQLLLVLLIVVLLAWLAWRRLPPGDDPPPRSVRPYEGYKWVLLPRPAGLAERTRWLAREGSPLADIEAFPIDDYPRLGAFCERLRGLPDHERLELALFAADHYPLKPDTDRWAYDYSDAAFPEIRQRTPGAMAACLAIATLEKSFRGNDQWIGSEICRDNDLNRPRDCWIVAMETVATIGCALVEGDEPALRQYHAFMERLGV